MSPATAAPIRLVDLNLRSSAVDSALMRVPVILFSALVFLLAGCGESLPDRLEDTYAIADFEIDGAARERTESSEAWYTTAEGSYGITQRFVPDPGIEVETVLAEALAAAEADGWQMEVPETLSSWYGKRPSPDGEGCDNVSIGVLRSANEVNVSLGGGRC